MKEFNVIHIGKNVDLVPHSKRWSPCFFFNLSTLQPINSLYVLYYETSNNYETKDQTVSNEAKQILTLRL